MKDDLHETYRRGKTLKITGKLTPEIQKIVSPQRNGYALFLYFCLRYQDIRPNDMEDKLIELIENSIKKNWDRKAFTDFNERELAIQGRGT